VAGPERFVPPEKRGVGLMFQEFALFPHLSILDNVAFGLKSLTRREAKAEAHAALDRVGLAHYANEYPHIPPAASSSAWRSPAPSRPARALFSWTSPSRVSTRGCAKKNARGDARHPA